MTSGRTGWVIQAAALLLPWPLRRRLLSAVFGYRLDPGARIGLSLVKPNGLTMAAGSTIGHLNVLRGEAEVVMERDCHLGKLNWIYAIPEEVMAGKEHPRTLVMKQGSAITSRHLIDCTGGITIERFAVVAGYRCQLLSHTIDIASGIQVSRPIRIGEYSFVSTGCIVVGGAELPPRSALGAGSTLRSRFVREQTIYSGVPAEPTGTLDPESGLFRRSSSHVS